MQSIRLRHNFETAHRLSKTPGKCQQIHGHSWWATLTITGPVDLTGKVMEFGAVKKLFRDFLDREYDHKLLLFENDPVVQDWAVPGLQPVPDDPTTENVARWIYEWAKRTFGVNWEYSVEVWETSVNCATYPGFTGPSYTWMHKGGGYASTGEGQDQT